MMRADYTPEHPLIIPTALIQPVFKKYLSHIRMRRRAIHHVASGNS